MWALRSPYRLSPAQPMFLKGALVPAALRFPAAQRHAHQKKASCAALCPTACCAPAKSLCLKESDYPGARFGILILKDGLTPGTDMREVLHLNDVVVDFKITANRPDCQSVLGVAREAAVALKKPFHPPVPAYETKGRRHPWSICR